MRLRFTKQLLLDSLTRDITAYYPHKKDWHEDDDINKPYRKEYQGCCENYIGCDEYERFDTGIEQGFFWMGIVQKAPTVGLCIRGTDDMVTWALNFCAGKTDIPNRTIKQYENNDKLDVEVHSGFHAGWLEISEKWFKYLDRAIAKGYTTVIIEGHSRGAAIAQDAALSTQRMYCEKLGILASDSIHAILMAAPSIYNKDGAYLYNKRVPNTLRITNGTDPVTKVPPVGMGFFPVGMELRVGFEWFSYLSPFEWLVNLLGVIPLLPINAVGVGISALSAGDHYPTAYRKNIIKYNGKIPNKF